MSLLIGVVVGEHSGDLLGADLMKQIKLQHPDAEFVGIGGPLMLGQGFNSLYPMDRLAVMGYGWDVISRIGELFKIRSSLAAYLLQRRADVFIGIDAPDFNLGLELRLRKQNIKVVHYVSPSVWAWKQYRLRKIKHAVDLMLTLLPFESRFYKRNMIPVEYVGHSLADNMSVDDNTDHFRTSFGLSKNQTIIAMLPGSRLTEVKRLMPVLLEVALKINASLPKVKFLLPAVNQNIADKIYKLYYRFLKHNHITVTDIPLRVVVGQSREAMAAANVVVLASGTATLEAMLLKKPMVVIYKLGYVEYAIVSRIVKTKYVALPNIIAGKMIVPELLQDKANASQIVTEVMSWLNDEQKCKQLKETFTNFHLELKQDASVKASKAILSLLNSK